MTTPFAQVQVSIGGGANTSGGVVCAFGASCAITATNTTGWTAALWEIVDYPLGFSAPSGWTTAASGVIYYQPTNPTTPPPTFNLPSSGSNNWGKFALRLRINGNPLQLNPDNSPNPSFTAAFTDTSTILSILSPNLQLPGICATELTQFDALRGWCGDWMKAMRKIDVAL